MDDMEIKKGDRCFYIGENQLNAQAEVTYAPYEKSKIIINHTYVSPELRRQKIGKQLIDHVANYCREENLKAIPVCSYAASVMKNTAEYEDVVSDWDS